ncbi:metal-dependent hydrolase [Marinobacterium sedimentorum]|uniref:metal-dependent hydrolase n=1 Tax=Marinobacterium sedimentorum TaxID=2927804 RepID=UPI0020C61F7C|nr:metal-dependent hydrolase [Marinobacterium sedimentorum]MCP8686747.1 metal-dependent hydrolase [Marinobacterium sedimentorum]
MADFKTHTLVATVISGGLGIAALATGMATPSQAFCYWLAGTLGGLLPDIDSDESLALRIVFRLFGALVAGLLAFYWMTTLPAWQVVLLAATGYLLVRFVLLELFARITVHRGMLHSLLANLLFGVIAILLSYHLFALDVRLAWGIGAFVVMGATVHLLLDEIYSVDLSGMRIKRSFGTALKLTDWTQPLLSALMLSACVGGFWLSPSAASWQQSLGIEVPPWLSVHQVIGWLYQSVVSLYQA